MSEFYATIEGMRSEKTTRGSKNSGIKASVQNWNGSVITELNLIERDDCLGEDLVLTIDTADNSTSGWGNRKFRGTLEQFNALMDAVNRFGTAEAIKRLNRCKPDYEKKLAKARKKS